MPIEELRILFVEDSPQDVDLEERMLRKGGLAFRSMRVETRESLVRALTDFKPSAVISDHTLPKLDGLSALKIVREFSQDIPFIFVTGTLGEERAVVSLKEGATDYVLKGRWSGLPHAVERALAKSTEQAERRRREAQVRESQRIEACSRMAGRMAREFNSFLAVVGGFVPLALKRLGPHDPSRADLQEVLTAGERAASVVRPLLAFGRQQVLKLNALDLNGMIWKMNKALLRIIGERTELECSLDLKIERIHADESQIEQILLVLAANAREAMPDGGKLTIETAIADSGAPWREPGFERRPKPGVLLAVGDTGRGMSEEIRSRLFEPFFSTKEPGLGTGLGLSTVHGVVSQSGGAISVISEPGKGSTFRICFPPAV